MSRNPALAKIHIAKKELAMDEDTYRAMLQNIAGVSSSKDLTDAGVTKVLAHLQRCGWKPKAAAKVGKKPSVGRGRKALVGKVEALLKVDTKWFHSDDGSRIQQMGLVMMGDNIPAGLQWKTMDSSFVEMTAALAHQVFTAVAASDQAIFSAAEAHRVAMESSPSPMDYDFSAGWPKTFGE